MVFSLDVGEFEDVTTALTITNGNPWFLACGIFRPHLPHYMPKELLDLFVVNDITASRAMLDAFYDDLDDVNGGGGLNSGDMYDLRAHGNSIDPSNGDVMAYQEQLRHYLASAALADRCVKRLLDALAASPWAGNTVVVLWSDHGWYLGEKYLFRKTKMWDEAANCVLVIRDPRPGMQAPGGTPCYRPVGLQDLYPTIVSLAGLTPPAHVAGNDISPLLQDPRRPWNIPAQTTYGLDSIRIGRWSYIRKSVSDTELYDMANDPDEQRNLSGNPAYASIKSKWRPCSRARPVTPRATPGRSVTTTPSKIGGSAGGVGREQMIPPWPRLILTPMNCAMTANIITSETRSVPTLRGRGFPC